MVRRVTLNVDCAFNEDIMDDPEGQFVMAEEALELERRLAVANALLERWCRAFSSGSVADTYLRGDSKNHLNSEKVNG